MKKKERKNRKQIKRSSTQNRWLPMKRQINFNIGKINKEAAINLSFEYFIHVSKVKVKVKVFLPFFDSKLNKL